MMNITLDLQEMLQVTLNSREDVSCLIVNIHNMADKVQDAMASLTAVLTSAVYDERPPYSLEQIHESLRRQSECFLVRF